MTSHWLDEALLAPLPRQVRPMWVAVEGHAFNREGWAFEVKYDGYRAVAELGESGVKVYSLHWRTTSALPLPAHPVPGTNATKRAPTTMHPVAFSAGT